MIKTIKIDNKEYKLEKLPLGRYAELLDALDKIPQHLQGLDGLSEENILKALPRMLKESLPEIIEVISIGSGIDKETITDEFGLADVAKIIQAIFEINEFKEVGKVLGALRPSPVKQEQLS